MLVSLSVSNFRSFHEEQTFSLVASNRVAGAHAGHAVPIPDSKESVLRAGVIYGANGAGKSNLFKALQYVTEIAIETRSKSAMIASQAFFRAAEEEPTIVDLQFVAGSALYRYLVKVRDGRVAEESLTRVVGTVQREIVERATNVDGSVRVVVASGLPPQVKNLANVGGPPNQSFLATLDANLNSSSMGPELTAVVHWFRELGLVAPDSYAHRLSRDLAYDAAFRQFAGEFLRTTATGISALDVKRTPVPAEVLRAFPPEVLKMLERSGNSLSFRPVQDVPELVLEKGNDGSYAQIEIQAAHASPSGGVSTLPLEEESDGTRRLLDLIPALHDLHQENKTYFIDEVDRSLHPLMAWELLRYFLNNTTGNRQLLLTTHESNLLDLDLLRRDEIWFAEKDEEGATRLYSLLDFKVRNDLEIRKHYLQGRFGAVPFLGDFQRLASETASEK